MPGCFEVFDEADDAASGCADAVGVVGVAKAGFGGDGEDEPSVVGEQVRRRHGLTLRVTRFAAGVCAHGDGKGLTLRLNVRFWHLCGELYEQHMLDHMKRHGWDDIAKPKFPNENTPEHPNRTDETDELVKAFENRARLRFRYLDTPRPGVYRVQGPAHGKSRSSWCVNHPATFAGKGKVPQSPCRKGDTCHCNSTLTLNETVNAKLRQKSVWNTADWKARYKQRNQVETFWGLPKAPTATGTTPPPSASAASTNAQQPPTASSEP